VARLGLPLFLLVITWLWGSALVGMYLLAYAMLEVASSAIIDAPGDATLVFGSHHAEHALDDAGARGDLYRVFATTMRVSLGLAIAVALLTWVGERFVILRFFPVYAGLVPGLYFLGASLVPRAISQTAIAATKSTLHMEHDALLNGLFYPLALLGGAAVVYILGGQLTALLAMQAVVETVLCALALRAFGRYFSAAELARAVLSGAADRKVLKFVIPQCFNLTFNRYIARLDSLMLAAFGLGKSELAYYGTAALLTSNLAQIRMIFSGALAPVVARFHSGGRREAFDETLGRVARWTTSLVVPALLLLLVFREDLVRLVSPDYGRNSMFVAVLLIPPFTNCAYGLAGACLMFTGHTRVTLANSLSVALLSTGLARFFIPRHGMLGAAVATAIATSIMTGLQMIELDRLERVAIRWRAVWKPHIGFALGLVPIVALWDPARLSIAGKVALATTSTVTYGVLMLVFRHEEVAALARRLRARLS
jgi:O-antigen/teichoic acid export membrane protein